jgi:hyperosmotically inducible protein
MRPLKLIPAMLLATSLSFAQADNTKKNKTDKAITADQQGQGKADMELTRKIRKLITDESTLSTYAKNIKVISLDGKVTLRGPVNTGDEKTKLEGLAASVAGAANVSNQIEIVEKK